MYRNGLMVLVVVAVFAVAGRAQQKPDPLFGEWQGESKCVGTNPYCHDEVVVYRFAPSKTDKDKIAWDAYKIIDHKLDLMGQLEMTYDRVKSTLSVDFKIPRTGGRGVWSLTVKGDEMTGTLTVFPENEVGRKVHVVRKKAD
jgi:hypothetical protein